MAYTYILTNPRHTVLYTGSTNDLRERVAQHKRGLIPGFTAKYGANILVYFERHDDIDQARIRERSIKGITRSKKEALINSVNDRWCDLVERI